MQIRKEPLLNEQYYHIYSRSIAKYIIFNDPSDFSRAIDIINVYRYSNFNHKYCKYKNLDKQTKHKIISNLKADNQFLVEIVAYCIMTTHFHIILKQVVDKGISKYLSKVLNSYSRYFNTKYHRSGPLWSGRFKSVLVSDDNQLLHLTRYIHLNPTSAGLVEKPEKWIWSSYSEYISSKQNYGYICSYKHLFDPSPTEYKKFVNDRKEYQQQLSYIKSLIIDNYTG